MGLVQEAYILWRSADSKQIRHCKMRLGQETWTTSQGLVGEPLWLGMPSVSPVPQVGPITGSLVPRAKPLHWPVCGLRHDESEAACF